MPILEEPKVIISAKCTACDFVKTIHTSKNDLPDYDTLFHHFCKRCNSEQAFVRIMTKRERSAIHMQAQEQALRDRIAERCQKYGFTWRYVYFSVVITTPLSFWSFDYHPSKKTLRHESTYKYNSKTGLFATTHEQFKNRRISIEEVIDYIASHDSWKMNEIERTKK